jgi:hypothetical protein
MSRGRMVMSISPTTIQEQLFVCPICKRRFRTLASLKIHFSAKHVLERCPVCGRKLNLGGMSAVNHFSRKKDRSHLAFAYLFLRSDSKRGSWKKVCEAAADHFSSVSLLISLLKKECSEL